MSLSITTAIMLGCVSFLSGALVARRHRKSQNDNEPNDFLIKALEQAGTGITVTDAAGHIKIARPRVEKSSSLFVGNATIGENIDSYHDRLVDAGHLSHPQMNKDELKAAFRSSRLDMNEAITVRRPDGTFVRQRSFALENGDIVYVRDDVSSESKALERTKSQLDLLHEISERMPVDMLIKNKNDAILYSSSGRKTQLTPTLRFNDTRGDKFSDLLKQHLSNGKIFLPGVEPEKALELLLDAEKTDGAVIEIYHANGAVLRRTTHHMPGERVLFIREDITEDRKIQEALDLRGQQLDAILNTTQSAVCGVDSAGRIVFANDRAKQLLKLADGLPTRWPTEIAFLERLSNQKLSSQDDPVSRAISGETLAGEVVLLQRGTAEATEYVRISCAPVSSLDLDDLCTVLVLDDVTEQELNHQQLERKGRLDALGQLTGGIAHDFNNLLSTIEYSISLAKEDSDPQEREELLGLAASSVARGAALTKRLLAFAKQQPGLARSVNMGEFLKNFKTLVEPTIEEQVELQFILEDQDILAHCDPNQLENALLNLILNSRDAIMHGRSGGTVSIFISRTDDGGLSSDQPPNRDTIGISPRSATQVSIRVQDDGPGMSQDVLERAADPFFTTKSVNSGSGLGLSMVYGFVEQSNGRMKIESEEGVGTSVTLFLPLSYSEQNAPDAPGGPAVQKGRQQKILIVEDEAPLLRLVSRIVEAQNYEVLTAPSAKLGLEALQAYPDVDLLLTDIMMPGGMDGFELAQHARDLNPTLPILYMSGYSESAEDRAAAVDAPFLQKPVHPVKLANAIARALDDF